MHKDTHTLYITLKVGQSLIVREVVKSLDLPSVHVRLSLARHWKSNVREMQVKMSLSCNAKHYATHYVSCCCNTGYLEFKV